MKTTVNFYDFEQAFRNAGRLTTNTTDGNFDYAGLRVLFDYLESFEKVAGEEIELDVIALCCEYSQQPILDVARDYNIDLSDCDDDEIREAVIDYLNEHTLVCGITSDDEIVYQQF